MAKYAGSCHCGCIQFEVEVELTHPGVCNCSYCRRRGTIGHYVDLENFKLLSGKESLSEYRFRNREAIHYFCKECGINPFAYYSYQGVQRYGVNLGCLEGVDIYALQPTVNDGAAYQ